MISGFYTLSSLDNQSKRNTVAAIRLSLFILQVYLQNLFMGNSPNGDLD